ncbi:heterocyst-inhibiting protein PatX [Limnospira platensis]|uniref:heterocyst-inhibiting protein PatX n=1 Tax=Limnospira platensis TaxID=118562 RepID=UPI0021AA7C5A
MVSGNGRFNTDISMKLNPTFGFSMLLLLGMSSAAQAMEIRPSRQQLESMTNQYMLSAQTEHHGSRSPWQGTPRRGFAETFEQTSPSESLFPHRSSGRANQ